jgi:hypothetical protein
MRDAGAYARMYEKGILHGGIYTCVEGKRRHIDIFPVP